MGLTVPFQGFFMRLFFLALFSFFLVLPVTSQAENQKLMDMLEATPSAMHDYKQATIKNLSKLYWALGRLDIKDDLSVDNYMLINECDIYKNYYQNEFEWNSIRQFARDHIQQNLEKFPIRFEFIQPLRLGEYSFEKQGFLVDKEYEIDGIRRFEIQALDFYDMVCGYDGKISGYPKGLLIELSRPVFFEILPMKPEEANEYINEKTIEFKKLATRAQKDSKVYNFRDIYLVLKVKFFSTAGDSVSKVDRKLYAKVLGALESIEIYDDLERKKLLFSENYQRKKRVTPQDVSKLKEQEAAQPEDSATETAPTAPATP